MTGLLIGMFYGGIFKSGDMVCRISAVLNIENRLVEAVSIFQAGKPTLY